MKLQFRDALTQGFPTKAGILGVILPTTWATANITFQVSQDNVTFHNLYSDAGTEVSATISATPYYTLTYPPAPAPAMHKLCINLQNNA